MQTVITYLIKNGDFLRDPLVITPNTRYVVITDNANIQSKIWSPVIIHPDSKLDVRATVAMTKFNPFVVNSEKYIIIDASHQIVADLTETFEKVSDSAILVKRHPAKVNIKEEICRWKTIRHMDDGHIRNINNFIMAAGDTYYNKPIYEGCFLGVTNSIQHRNLFSAVLKTLELLRYNDVWFPSNQIVLSLLIHRLGIPVLETETTSLFKRYHHNTWQEIYG